MTNKPKFKIGDRVKALGVLSGKTGNIYLIKLSPAGYFSYCIDSYPECYIDEHLLELVEEKPEPQPKIDMVVKCIDRTAGYTTCNGLTNNKFYVAEGSWKNTEEYLIKNNDFMQNQLYCKEKFKTFKVGEKYTGTYVSIKISKFWVVNNLEKRIRVQFISNELGLHECDIDDFDRLYTKIEDEPKKEIAFQPGDYIEIMELGIKGTVKWIKTDGCMTFQLDKTTSKDIIPMATIDLYNTKYTINKKSITLSQPAFKLNQSVKILNGFGKGKHGEINLISRSDDNQSYIYSIITEKRLHGDECIGGIFENNLIAAEAEWQPKFEVGDWVIHDDYISPLKIRTINSTGYECVLANGDLPLFADRIRFTDDNLILWQPIQDLKDTIESQKLTIADLEDKLAMEKGKNKALHNENNRLIQLMVSLELHIERLKSNSKWWKM